ncbi:MAG: DUF3598 family protein [Pyrinomonadaceae bacterium]|nr:DUF3598 family protein [Pyrinomonadaceae bacterium]MCX7640329.1 DUF3598 family protein [Pyrinomonadaceae bacterium]MDW8304756.1 DUF3598 family protein [Acidobacteriota bacterium]
MSAVKEARLKEFPVVAKHIGVWEGTYTRMDARTGQILDRHRSRLTCKILDDGSYWQQNEYFWDDGRTEVKQFPGEFKGKALHFDNERLIGDAYEVDPKTICLFWENKNEPGVKYAEIISLESDTHRCRVWQHFENGEFTKITVIDERKVG